MANISTSSIFNKYDYDFDSVVHEKLFKLPFSEQDLLELQEIFVTLGMHIIKVKDMIEGRQIVKIILNSLKYYHNIGCITDVTDLPVNVCNITSHIALQCLQNKQGNSLLNLETFLNTHPCFDFIWIELTKNIKKEYSYKTMKNIFDMYHIEERMPVLIVTYENE